MKLQILSPRFLSLVSLSCLWLTGAHAGSPSPGGKGQTTRIDAEAIAPKAAPIMIGRTKASPTGILARLKNPGMAGAATATLDKQGLKVGRNFGLVPGLQRLVPKPAAGGGIRAFDQKALLTAIKALRKSGLYEYVEPDWKVQIMQVPTDSGFTDGSLWGLRNTGQNGGTAGVDVDAVAAWGLTAGSPSVVVGVIDTGIRYTHQDLAANMWTNPGETAGNGVDDDGNGIVDDVFGINAITGSGNPMDDNDHGSHCAGTIAATANGGGQHVGVAYNVRLMALKFLDASGSGNTSDAITCIDYAVAKGADILSNSWGGGGFSQGLNDSIEAASTAGVLFVAAAGNSASDNDMMPNYPSNYEAANVIAVAAIDRTGALAGFSSYGASSVDVGAPGVEILSCTAQSDTSYASFQGTSMATPHVAGVAALVASQYPGIGLAELRARVVQTAAPLSSLAGRVASGGMVDAHAALTAVPDGNLELRVETDGLLQEAQASPIRILVSDLLPVTGATVTANLDGQAAVPFLDNGTTPDTTAGDGVYTAMMTPPAGVGTVDLNVQASAPGKNPASGVFTLTVTIPPPNDDFAARVALAAGTTQTTGSNRFASQEAGEPLNPSVAGGRTVWWQWTAPAAGSATISTTGSDFDTTLAVYTGASLGGLSLVGSNDDASGLQSSVTFSATSGTSYLIQVDGYAGQQGNIQLNYPAPGGAPGAPFIVTQPVGRSVVVGTGFSLSVVAGGLAPLEYQWFRDGDPLPGAMGDTYTVGSAAAADQGFYQVEVSNSVDAVLSNAVYVAVNPVGVRPGNDDFAAAIVLAGASGREYGSNVLATGQSGEPDHADNSTPIGSIWYAWTAPAAGQLAIDTFGADFDTTLAAYTGSSVAALAVVAENDDSGSGVQSATIFSVTEGTTYHIAVDGVASAEGLVVLNYAFSPSSGAPPNDAFANGFSLGSGDSTVAGSNVGATGEPDEPNHALVSSPIASVWWSWTAPASGNATVSTSGSDFDTTLAVYTGSALASLVEVASNDDASGLTSQVSFPVTAGTEYRIAVDGYGLSEGSVVLTVGSSGSSSISGTVTGPNGVTPLAGVDVTAYVAYWDEWDEYWYYDSVASATTASDGTYQLTGLDAGDYRVGFRDPSGNHLTEYYDNAPDISSAMDIAVGASSVVGGVNASLAAASRMTGIVTGPDGVTPLSGIEVHAYVSNGEGGWNYAAYAFTQEDGTYNLGELIPGTYRVLFAGGSGYVTEYYNNASDLASATDIVVGAATVVGGINASLAEKARLTGTVTGPDGVAPLAGIDVTAYVAYWDEWDEYWYYYGVASATTASDGTYQLAGLDEGNYRVRFRDPSGNYLTEYYDNASNLDAAADIGVGASTVVGGINASLAAASKITGIVTGPDGVTPLPEIEVNAYVSDGEGGWNYAAYAFTQEDGSYNLGGLIPGTYRVLFYGGSSYITEYYNNVPDLASAADIVVSTATVVGGINASLAEKARITGTVTGPDGVAPLAGIELTAYVARWDELDEYWYYDSVASATTASDGSYQLAGLDAGNYRVRFRDPSGNYLTEYYDNVANLGAATDIAVGASSVVGGIDASLAAASRITGIVTGPDGVTPLLETEVNAYVSDGEGGWNYAAYAYTQEDGSYNLGGLMPGTYRVVFYGGASYVTEYYNNAPDLASATDIVVGAATVVGGINASLAEKARITGTVTGPDGVAPLAGIEVTAYVAYWDAWDEYWYYDNVASATTASDGTYQLAGLNAGNYRLRFHDPSGNHLAEYYDNAPDLASATDIVVGASSVVGGIDASLAAASRISGIVTGPDGVTPLLEIQVSAYVSDGQGGWNYATYALTQEDGSYNLPGLMPGTYRVAFYGGSSYLTEYYNDALDFASATDIVVEAATVVGGINASLAEKARIAGTVTGPNGVTPLAGIDVTAYAFYWDEWGEEWSYYPAATAVTGADGGYELAGLDVGSYRIGFVDPSGVHLAEYYDNSQDLASAAEVAVSGPGTVAGIDASLSIEGWQQPAVSGLRMTGPGAFEMDFTGMVGRMYQLEESTNLREWTDVGAPFVCQPGGNLLQMESGTSEKFWRVKEAP